MGASFDRPSAYDRPREGAGAIAWLVAADLLVVVLLIVAFMAKVGGMW